MTTRKLSEKEISAMLNKPAKDRYLYSIKEISAWESAWLLSDEEGFVLASNNEGVEYIPIWPFQEYAVLCKAGEWQHCMLQEMPLSELLEEFLPNLLQDGVGISIFMVPDGNESIVIPADSLLADLNEECSKY